MGRGSSSNTAADFLRNWINTFHPVEEEHFKRQLQHCRLDLEHNIKTAVKNLREELEGTLASCMEMSTQVEATVRSSKEETLVLVTRAKYEALRLSIGCLEAVNDEGMRSSLLSNLLEQEDRQKRRLPDASRLALSLNMVNMDSMDTVDMVKVLSGAHGSDPLQMPRTPPSPARRKSMFAKVVSRSRDALASTPFGRLR